MIIGIMQLNSQTNLIVITFLLTFIITVIFITCIFIKVTVEYILLTLFVLFTPHMIRICRINITLLHTPDTFT